MAYGYKRGYKKRSVPRKKVIRKRNVTIVVIPKKKRSYRRY